MTIKELADLLNVTKPTITKAIKELDISPTLVSNRYVVNIEEIEKIIKVIRPTDHEELLKKAENIEKTGEKTENIEKIENANTEKTAKNTEKSENQNAKSENSTNDRLISMLEKALEDKENTIRQQQNTIDSLLKTNIALTSRVAMLEDKEKDQEPVIIQDPQEPTAEEHKKHWWQRIFG